jgi:uncharacterized spore protein YtfJ
MTSEIQPQPQATALTGYGDSTAAVSAVMEKFLSAADVQAVYGEPVLHGEHMVIPSAEVLSAVGFGLGSGGGPGGEGGGGGGGGGGRMLSRPVAAIIAGPDGVRIEPIVDVTKIALAFLTAVGFMAGMAGRMKRGR